MGMIKIAPVLNGWIVTVKCTEVVFTDKRLMMKEISRYIADPKSVEKEYLKNDKNPERASNEQA